MSKANEEYPQVSDLTIHYPVTVDAKKLWALIRTGDAIIRKRNFDRIEGWRKLKVIIAEQCNQNKC